MDVHDVNATLVTTSETRPLIDLQFKRDTRILSRYFSFATVLMISI